MDWNELSMADRAKYIQIAVANGVTNLSHIKDTVNKYDMGGGIEVTAPIENPVIPESDDPKSVEWLANWYNGRREQLKNNINEALKGKISDIEIRTRINPLNWFRSESFNRQDLNKMYYELINNAASAREVPTDKESYFKNRGIYTTGSFYPYKNTIEINPFFDKYNSFQDDVGITKEEVRIHERTHASRPDILFPSIRRIINNGHMNESVTTGISENYLKYLLDPNEINSRMNEFRYRTKLTPDKVIDKDFLDNNRDNLKQFNLDIFDDETILRLLNEIAQNNSIDNQYNLTPETNYAAKGGRINKFGGGGTKKTSAQKARESNTSSTRVNISNFTTKLNRNRPVNVADLSQLQDSLIGRNYPEAQRLAILATAAQEMDSRGFNSKGVGGNGALGLSSQRMPVSLLNKGREGDQIKFLLDDLETTHSDNWLDGGSGGPKIMNGQEGFDLFWGATDPELATKILNKSYIRPAGKVDSWNNRASVAKTLKTLMK